MSYDVQAQTALDTIKRSLRLIRALGESEEPSAQAGDDAMLAFNGMLHAWSTERLMLYELTEESFTWPADTVSRTIGSGANFNTVRPMKIISAFIRESDVDTPLVLIDRDEYDLVETKSDSIYPEALFYDPTYPSGTLYIVYPPSESLDLHLSSMKPFTQLTALTTQLAFPPGYYDACCFNLAIRLAPEFGKTPSPDVVRVAGSTKRNIKSLNIPSMVSGIDLAPSHSNIISG